MEEYRFEHKEPLTQRVVLALRVNTKQLFGPFVRHCRRGKR